MDPIMKVWTMSVYVHYIVTSGWHYVLYVMINVSWDSKTYVISSWRIIPRLCCFSHNLQWRTSHLVHGLLLLLSRFTVVLMKRCPKATKTPYNKLQPSYPHEWTFLVAETLMHSPFKTWGEKKPFWWSISPIYFAPKIGEDFYLFPNFSKLLLLAKHDACLLAFNTMLVEF